MPPEPGRSGTPSRALADDGAVGRTTWSSGTSPYWKWTAAGTYQVRLTVVDDDGVKSSVLIPVTVH